MPEEAKRILIELFKKNVQGKRPDLTGYNSRHCGREGHWLEQQMGKAPDRSSEADFFGYELKNVTTSGKTTFGDWSADTYIFTNNYLFNRDRFLQTFGKPNISKGGRCSWSGEPCPTIHSFNSFGQKLEVDSEQNIRAIYSYPEDQRRDKSSIVPEEMQLERLILATWSSRSLRRRVEKKFNQNGWFKCLKDGSGRYSEIVFGKPISFDTWISCVKTGDIYFDSGMYQTNDRPYSQWRANNDFWDKLIISRHR